MGYELAQLTDDRPLFEVGDWTARELIFDAYFSSLQEGGPHVVERSDAWQAYRASVLARAVRNLTDPTSEEILVTHGRSLLSLFAEGDTNDPLSSISLAVLDAWNTKRGLKATDSPYLLSESDRRRISKALSYHLRHDPELVLEDGGWIDIGSLSEHVSAKGMSLSVNKILSVAQAADEERFEVARDRIRAYYGHSRAVEMNYEKSVCDSPLFHAMPSASVSRLIDEGDGLTPQQRQWVHLTTDPSRAIRAGRRHGHPVLLEIDPTQLQDLVFAAGVTWLAKLVPLSSIRVVPLRKYP